MKLLIIYTFERGQTVKPDLQARIEKKIGDEKLEVLSLGESSVSAVFDVTSKDEGDECVSRFVAATAELSSGRLFQGYTANPRTGMPF